MVLNAAVQMLREADELKEKIIKFKSGTSMLQELNIWTTQQQLQKVYQKLLVLDLDYALDKKVEQDLWNIGFKQQIEALQAISKDRKNPLRSEGQAMLSWVLQAAAGFYLCLLHQLCTTFKLDLPFRRRASLLGWVEGWGAGEHAAGARLPAAGAARYICQHCLVHLGDLARYKQQLRVAHSFYRQAVSVWAHSGQPYNQLALVASRRAHRLPALYWHVRALLVRAPFPPAPANLSRTLRAAASQTSKDLPVLPGITSITPEQKQVSTLGRLDSHSYITDLIRALNLIHTVEELVTAGKLVTSLNSSLTALIATDSFESATLIKMACVVMWAVHSSTEEFSSESALSEGETEAAELSCALAAGSLLALLLPAYSADRPPQRALPPLKVWLQWTVSHPQILRSAAWSSRAALWSALAHNLNMLADKHRLARNADAAYETVPLPEDEELHGFLPLEVGFKGLRFHNHAAWDTYGGRLPDIDNDAERDSDMQSPSETARCFTNEPQLEERVRAYRLVELGKRLAQLRPEHFSYTEEDDVVTFTAASAGGEQLSLALAELSAARAAQGEGTRAPSGGEGEDESDDEPGLPTPPVIISEADFREKFREKRVGILKPQGSLERAREERAQATTIEEQDTETADDSSKCDDKKEARKPRVNIAMAAIMKKQEETNKQVKFVTPPPTPESTVDNTEVKDQDKPKMIQPKPVKSLANLPLGRKTGGILSLKDKSAGYPHLVNTDPEPTKKPEKEEKKEPKLSQGTSQNTQTYHQKRQEHAPAATWPAVNQPNYQEPPRMTLQKNYGIQNAGISYNPTYQANGNQSIRLPVVNPKEIDVRTAALQKQNSRQDVFQDGAKFGNHSYQMSGDKKNFLNDLPPRFANQYRYWQTAQENQLNENKFKDDTFKPDSASFNNQQRSNWPESYQQPMQWWKPENPPNFNANYSMNVQPNYFAPQMNANVPNPYQNVPFNPPLNNLSQQNKPDSVMNPGYLQPSIGQQLPQLQTLQNLVTSPNFNSSLGGFDSYGTNVGYDSSMYPHFGNKMGYQPLQMKVPDKTQAGYQGNKDMMDMTVGFGSNAMDMQQRNFPMNFNEQLNDYRIKNNMDHIGIGERSNADGPPGSTYSLFSGAPDTAAWGSGQRHPAQQSLWSGPGPSPLERLLEQQKLMKQPPPAPQ